MHVDRRWDLVYPGFPQSSCEASCLQAVPRGKVGVTCMFWWSARGLRPQQPLPEERPNGGCPAGTGGSPGAQGLRLLGKRNHTQLSDQSCSPAAQAGFRPYLPGLWKLCVVVASGLSCSLSCTRHVKKGLEWSGLLRLENFYFSLISTLAFNRLEGSVLSVCRPFPLWVVSPRKPAGWVSDLCLLCSLPGHQHQQSHQHPGGPREGEACPAYPPCCQRPPSLWAPGEAGRVKRTWGK